MSEEKRISFFPAEALQILKEAGKQKREGIEYLKSLPHETHSTSREELGLLRGAYKVLGHYVQSVMDEVRDKSEAEKKLAYGDALQRIIKWLDERDFAAKFSTSITEDSQEKSEEDSLYYMTRSGATLRVKRAELAKGLDQVIRHPMEKCLFADDMGAILRAEPVIGLSVLEYSSPEFRSNIRDDKDTPSSLRMYRDKGEVVGALFDGEGRKHHGHPVNHVYYAKF